MSSPDTTSPHSRLLSRTLFSLGDRAKWYAAFFPDRREYHKQNTGLDLRCRNTLLSLEVNIVGARQKNADTYLPRSSNQLTREHSSWRGRYERLVLTAIKARDF